MEAWIAANWWWILPPLVFAVYVAYRIQTREKGAPVMRGIEAVFPLLDPNSSERRQLTPRLIVVLVVGFAVVLTAALIEVVFR